jgi:diaminohydroxyphosphoribosylaminopyrimidine deaminase/5-amino-6-(5-phosphoribosylamino)uracil reductase
MYVTLEPCSHQGRTPPCVDAIIRAGIARVVFGVCDPTREAAGGGELLRRAGIEVTHTQTSAATDVTAPFLWSQRTGLPWITAKWAQSVDGRIATRTGASQWFSGDRARALVHRERGRVDAVLTGMGTVRSDDPLLTARNVRCKRIAKRVVIAPRADLPLDSALVQSARETPVILACLPTAAAETQQALKDHGVIVHKGVPEGTRLDLRETISELATAHDIRTVLAEAGPGLISSLLDVDLVREIAVFVAPLLVGDDQAPPPIRGFAPATVEAARSLVLRGQYRRGNDMLVRYGVPEKPNSAG